MFQKRKGSSNNKSDHASSPSANTTQTPLPKPASLTPTQSIAALELPPFMPTSASAEHIISSSPSISDSDLQDEFTMIDANISDSDYASRCRELMALHSELSKLGAGDLLDLPRIVVIGGQSAGKSSLVEGVSGIAVPRDSGTCTRCPMECNLSTSSNPWSCNISLRYEYDDSGKMLSSSKTEAFCSSLKDKSLVDIWLRRAQTAILCSHKPSGDFMKMTADELRTIARTDSRMLKFSRNTIRVEIQDLDATDLSFLDLPGLIQNESQETIDLVRGLVEAKIGGSNSQNTLILVTIPMSDDMENQQAVLLARQADPDGERTIGVLTKPDMLTTGATNARKKWKDIIEGTNRTHYLQHGYYCVRLSDDDERARNVSRSQAQKIAEEFFRSTPPWNQIEAERFGIPVFVNNISSLLLGMIENNIPKLKQDVAKLLKDCQKKLIALPSPVTRDPCTEILLRTTAYCKDLNAAISGERFKQLAQKNREQYLLFKYAIRRTAPDFQPDPAVRCVDSSIGGGIKWATFEDDDDEPAPVITSPPRVAGTGPLDLSYVKKVIKDSISWELPGYVPFDATKHIILQFTKLWRDPTIACFNATFDHLTELVEELIGAHFGLFKLLSGHVNSLVKKEIDNCRQEALVVLNKMLELESTPVFTQNTHYLEDASKKWLQRYSAVYKSGSAAKPRPLTGDEQSALKNLASAGHGSVSMQDIAIALISPEHREELVVMSKVRAYFQVAYKRIIDYIPLAIEHELNQALVNKLQENLFKALVNESRERMEELVAEDPAVSKKRTFLEERIKRLVEIQIKLDDVRR